MQITNRQAVKYTLILATFLVSMYIGTWITFYNNDDWVHYKTVENFLSGDFSLHPYIGSTFFTQGILAYFFSKLFGIERLPILTILVSLLNIYVFHAVLHLVSEEKKHIRILTLLFFIINPIYLYSSIGFMTENYVLLFIMLGIYFHLKFQTTRIRRHVIYENFAYILGFFTKHYSIFLNFAAIIYYSIKKKWLALAGTSLFTLATLAFYYFAFPRNEVLSSQAINIDLLSRPSLLLNIFLYVTFFTLPLNIILIFKLKTHRLLTITLFAIIFFISWHLLQVEDFPSLGNVLTRKGLFPDIDGNKSHWAGYHKFFTYVFYVSLTTSSLLISKVILAARYIYIRNKFLTLCFLSYLGLSLILPNFYDRYLLPLIVIWMFIVYTLLSQRKNQTLGIFFAYIWLSMYALFNYLYVSDYIVRNVTIAQATNALIEQGISPQIISANRSWNSYYEVNPAKIDYAFSYDNQNTFDQYSNFKLYKIIPIDFPLNIFTDKQIYLYQINENK